MVALSLQSRSQSNGAAHSEDFQFGAVFAKSTEFICRLLVPVKSLEIGTRWSCPRVKGRTNHCLEGLPLWGGGGGFGENRAVGQFGGWLIN